MEKATFAAGCFWGVEEVFSQIEGVVATTVGYTGGKVENPSYEQVCGGQTGHAEAVLVEFDATKVSYDKLLEAFWDLHDPTTPNRQGPDVGTQYRSAIFFHHPEQEKTAKISKETAQNSEKFEAEIVTEILPASTFYRAEDYHQKHFKKQSCRIR